MRDTIAAVATARGRAGIGVLRISGTQARRIATAIAGGELPARRATLRALRASDGSVIDRGLVLFFPAPGSYTGEDVVELHAHGGGAVLDLLLERVLAAGARAARPGEFTERAFLEGRIDLVQAEAVADLIDAGSREAARAAQATLGGEFSRRVNAIAARVTALRVRLEASLDFADEDVAAVPARALEQELRAVGDDLERTIEQAARGVRLRDGLRAVLVGAPNVGKSSVLNRLAGEERAIVTPIPGTTRDLIRASLTLHGASIELVDTAGLRPSDDVVEQAGMARTREHARHADLVLVIEDDRDPGPAALPDLEAAADVLRVRNKVDLSAGRAGEFPGGVRVSALTGAGFDALTRTIAARASHLSGDGAFTARTRHVEALREALQCVGAAAGAGGDAEELVAEDLRRAQAALGRITGAVTSDDLLGRIFATFCIGK